MSGVSAVGSVAPGAAAAARLQEAPRRPRAEPCGLRGGPRRRSAPLPTTTPTVTIKRDNARVATAA